MTTRVGMLEDVAAERLALADELEALSEAQWATTTLYPAWIVHEVVAHLTLSPLETVPWFLWRAVRAGFSIDRATVVTARERARRFGPAELLAQLRATARVDRRLAISGPLDPLNDLLVHAQDIAIPLGRSRTIPLGRGLACLRFVWRAPIVRADRRFAGLRLVATDADWAEGGGPEVRGPVSSLLLVANGRAAGLAGLHGEGLDEARRRVR